VKRARPLTTMYTSSWPYVSSVWFSTISPPTSAAVYEFIPNAWIPSLLRIGCHCNP
jgi:hypothetical protein